MLSRRSLITALFAVASAAACSGGDGMSPVTDGGSASITVSASTTPTYNWNGPLAVSVNVSRVAAPTVAVWGVSSPLNRDIASGVTHGIVPPGATETSTTERILSAGVKYRVTIALIDGTTGSMDFIP